MESRPRIVCFTLCAALAASLACNWFLVGKVRRADAAKDPLPNAAPAVRSVPVPVAAAPEPLRVVNANFESWNNAYAIRFDRELAAADLSTAVTLEPAAGFTVRRRGDDECVISAEFKPGAFYRIVVGKGVAATDGGRLAAPRTFGFIAPDLDADLRFLTRGLFYRPDAAVWKLPVRITNPVNGKVTVSVSRAYDSSLPEFIANPGEHNTKLVRELVATVKTGLNEPVSLDLDLAKAGIAREPGVYLISLDGEEVWWSGEERKRVVVVTDLALQAVQHGDELVFALRTVSGAAPVAGAGVTLYSRKLQKLTATNTDAEGFGTLTIPATGDRRDYPALLVAEYGSDRGFLELTDLKVRSDVAAAPRANGLRAFLFPERGVCRPGETLTLFGMLRDGKTLLARAGVPAEFVVRDPAGKIFARLPASGEDVGFHRARVTLPDSAATGAYRVALGVPGAAEGGEYGTTEFHVGEYVPDQLQIQVEAALAGAAEPAVKRIGVSGHIGYYFGAPLVRGALTFSATGRPGGFEPKKYPGFLFGYAPESFRFKPLTAKGESDEKGDFSTRFELPQYQTTPATPVIYSFSAFARSGAGGRGVTGRCDLTVHHAAFYLGTREAGTEPDRRLFELTALTPEEEPFDLTGRKFTVVLERLEWNYVRKEERNRLVRVWQQETIPVSRRELELDHGRFAVALPAAGNYALRLLDDAGNTLNRREFWHSRGEAGERAKNPAVLSFELDREQYRPGDTAKLAFDSPFAGDAVVVPGGAKLEKPLALKVKPGRNEVELPIPAAFGGGNWFAGVTVVGRGGRADDPQRLFGVAELVVDQRARRLDVELEAPQLCRPGGQATVRIALRDADGKPAAGRVQLWAVDEGVLALTNFATPDPYAFFFGQYGCPFRFGDVYSNFYPQLEVGRDLIGGDAAAAHYFSGRSEKLKAPAVIVPEPVDVPASGTAELGLALPVHTGALRLMAFAANQEKTGRAERVMTLRDELSIHITAPRFVAPGDEFEVLLEGVNHESADSTATWSVTVSGTAADSVQRGDFTLARTVPRVAMLRFRAPARSGEIKITAELKSDEHTVRDEVTFPVRSPFPAVDTLQVATVGPGETREFTAPAAGSLEIGSPFLALTGALTWLNEYPYGCVEQTAAGAFPFLAVEPLVKTGLIPAFFAADADGKLRDAIARISTMRLGSGDFAMWPGERRAWAEGSLFVFHFLLEADASGIALEPGGKRDMANYLRNYINQSAGPTDARAYALYLLSLADPAAVGPYAKLVRTADCGSFEKFLVGAALIRGNRADEGIRELEPVLKFDFWRNDAAVDGLHSETRRLGLALWILADLLPDSPVNPVLGRELQSRINSSGNWGTTQENAWAALGLARLAAKSGAGPVDASVAVGKQAATGLAGSCRIAGGVPATVANRGKGPVFVYTRTRAVPAKCEPIANGFTIRRDYLDAAGNPVASCAVGDLLQVRITVAAAAPVGNVVISDLLPAGLEIEDERLLTRSAVFDRPDPNSNLHIRVAEKRFDRFVAFGDFRNPGEAELRYRARATVRGNFVRPPVQIESMYRPDLRANDGAADAMFTIQ